MNLLSNKIIKNKKFPIKIIQFGEGTFIRSFFDSQIDKLNKNNLFNSSICVIGPRITNKIKELRKQNYLFTVIEQGVVNEKKVKNKNVISSIGNGIDPYTEYSNFLEISKLNTIEFIVSNTTEAGLVFDKNDKKYSENKCPISFPAKLTALLYKRFFNNKKGFIVIPLELVKNNGIILKELIIKYANYWNLQKEFIKWVENENIFINTLVDKIVPGYPSVDIANKLFTKLNYTDKFLSITEPYELLVLETINKNIIDKLPLKNIGINVIWTKNIKKYREKKVYLLNAPHTIMAILGLQMGIKNVLEFVQKHGKLLNNLVNNEIIPVLNYPKNELSIYFKTVIDRYKNPFNEHLLESISLNGVSKFKIRLIPIIKKNSKIPQIIVFSLSTLIYWYKNNPQNITINDNEIYVKEIQNTKSFNELFQNKELWGYNLDKINDFTDSVYGYYKLLKNKNVEKIIKIWEK